MNLIIMSGRPTADPEIRYTPEGDLSRKIANFNFAVARKYKKDGQPDADFFNCTAFGKLAESIEKHVKKGTKLLIRGSLQNDNYEKDGVKHYQIRIIVESWEFAESKKAAGEENPESNDGFMNIPTGLDDECPFV